MIDPNSQEVTDIAGSFTGSVFAMFFPNIGTDAGQEFLRSIIVYMLGCYPDLEKNCPKVWECFYLNWLAYTLSTWPVTITATEDGTTGGLSVEDQSQVQCLQSYLKSTTIGGKKCEWALYEHKHNKCNDSIKDGWKLAYENILADCECTTQIWTGGGSWFVNNTHHF